MDEVRFSQSHGVRAGFRLWICRRVIGRNFGAKSSASGRIPTRLEPTRKGRCGVLHSRQFIDKAPPAAGRRAILVLDPNHVPHSGRTIWKFASAAIPNSKPELLDRPEPMLVLGHHQAEGARQMELLLPLRAGHLQPMWWAGTQESSRLAKVLIAQSYSKQEIVAGGLTLHADRGSSMSSKALALLLADLGVTKSHSRSCL